MIIFLILIHLQGEDMELFLKENLVERKNTYCLKWDKLDERFGDPDLLAMWVADMEFKTPKAVIDGLKQRVEHGVFGYAYTKDSYYQEFFSWMKDIHDVVLKKEWIRFNFGVVNTIYNLVNLFTQEKESILIMAPVYYPFWNSIKDNNRNLIANNLIYNDKTGEFDIDYEELENDIKNNDVKLVIFCSPHNPAGRIWDKHELKKCFDIFKKYGVIIISDEIHQDLQIGDKKFISALALDNASDYFDNLIVLNAASKTFNLACLLNSHIIIPDEKLRAKYDAFAKRFNQIETNILGMLATELAYKNGREWRNGLLKVIKHNFNYLKNELQKDSKTKNIIISPLEGTYLALLNLNPVINKERTKEFIQDDCKIAIDFGEWFGSEYKGFIRINLATNPKYIEECVSRMIKQLNTKDYK